MNKCPACGAANLPGEDECASCQAPLAGVGKEAPKPGMEKRILDGRLADLKPRAGLTTAPSETLEKAVAAMRQAKAGCLLVLEEGKLAGMLSERELLLKTSEATDFAKTSVREVMRQAQTVLAEDDELADAIHHMALSGHRHLPVRLGGGQFGVISARDLLRHLCR